MGSNERPDVLFDSFRMSIDKFEFGESLCTIRRQILDQYIAYSRKALAETSHKEYCALQVSWNYQVLLHASKYFLSDVFNRDRLLSLGSFLGLAEMACAHIFREVVCVDIDNYVLDFKPGNVRFHPTDLDTGRWELPEGRFNAVFMVEILEHLFWSPIPLLKWIQRNCEWLVITTPDDREWPPLPAKPYSRYQHFSAIPSAHPDAKGNPAPMFHCKQYTQSEFVELLTFCGFRIVEFRRIGSDSKQMLAICSSRGT